MCLHLQQTQSETNGNFESILDITLIVLMLVLSGQLCLDCKSKHHRTCLVFQCGKSRKHILDGDDVGGGDYDDYLHPGKVKVANSF